MDKELTLKKAKEIKAEYFKKYREENKDKLNEYQRQYRANHKEKVKQYNQTYWLKKASIIKSV